MDSDEVKMELFVDSVGKKHAASLAPVNLFKNHFDKEPFPRLKNGFKIGMRLEAIDPKHQSLFCLVSVAEIRGFRLRLHFDGYPDNHDIWVNYDSPNIFPLGWCEKNRKILQPPKEFAKLNFSWQTYLEDIGASAAPKSLFPHLRDKGEKALTPIGFRIGMKLEALDLLSPDRDVCVASVTDILSHDNRFLVHLDGKDGRHDFWAEPTCPHVHPMDWSSNGGRKLNPPPNYAYEGPFDWNAYLASTCRLPAPARAFKNRPACPFRVGMKLEVVDPLNPVLIRVATVVDIWTSKLKIHFDGWAEEYDFWVEESSPDIHPPGWCSKTGYTLQPPVNMAENPASEVEARGGRGLPGAEYCPTPGCKGLGHLNNWHDRHFNILNCPYFKLEQDKTLEADRITNEPIPPTPQFQVKRRPIQVAQPRWLGQVRSDPPSGLGPERPAAAAAAVAADAHLMNGGLHNGLMNGNVSPALSMPALVPSRHGPPTPPPESDHSPPFLPPGHPRPPDVVAASVRHSVFSPPFLPPPAPDVPLCWQHQSNLLPGVTTISQSGRDAIAKWSPSDVAAFVSNIPGCEELGSVFEEEAVDGEALLLLQQDDLVNFLKLKLGPAVKIYNAIIILKNSGEIPPPPLPCVYRLNCDKFGGR